MKYKAQLLVLSAAIASGWIQALDNPHFYRATNMFLEPRLEHDYLTTFNATIGGGSTKKGRNGHNTIVPLLDIYGLNTVPTLGTAITNLSIDSTFRIIESNLSFAQNLAKGFFLFFYLPVRSLTIKDINIPNFSVPQLNAQLAPYGISANPT